MRPSPGPWSMQESVHTSVFVDAQAQVSRRCVADILNSHVAENIVHGQLSAIGRKMVMSGQDLPFGREIQP